MFRPRWRVSVSVIRRDQDDGANTNKLDAARQALREQVAQTEASGISKTCETVSRETERGHPGS